MLNTNSILSDPASIFLNTQGSHAMTRLFFQTKGHEQLVSPFDQQPYFIKNEQNTFFLLPNSHRCFFEVVKNIKYMFEGLNITESFLPCRTNFSRMQKLSTILSLLL